MDPLLTSRGVLLLDALCALMVHGIYRTYEIHPIHTLPTLALLLGTPSSMAYLLTSGETTVAMSYFLAFTTFYSALLGSIVLYRISPFHPLAGYPGPILAKVTKLYAVRVMSTGKNHLYHKELHERYGPYVRVGPNEISVVDGKHISDVLGLSGLPKGPMWDGRRNPKGARLMMSIRDPHEHARRRRPWNRAFSLSALKDYEPAVQKRAQQLIRQLGERANKGSAVNLKKWMKYFTFDFMGDMLFGGGFETMEEGAESVPILESIAKGTRFVALIQHLPWLVDLLYKLPTSTKPIDGLRRFSGETVKKRIAQGSLVRDVYSYLMDDSGANKDRPTEEEITSDGLTAMIAGYDTTASVLAAILYYVIGNTVVYERLQEEVDEHFQKTDISSSDTSKLAELPYLNAVINEGLRLGCPVNVIHRGTTHETGPKWVGSRYIPANTAVDVPLYVLLRDPENFSPAPEEFRPERFLSKAVKTGQKAQASEHDQEEDLTTSTSLAAFIPFSFGPENCAGRMLAMVELRVVTALMMHHFDMKFAEGYDPNSWQERLQDWYVMAIGDLPVVLTQRAPIL